MLDHEDQQLEERLKKFRPLAAEPLPVARNVRTRSKRLMLAMCMAAAVATVVVAAVIARQQYNQPTGIQHKIKRVDVKVKPVDLAKVMPPASGRPLTIKNANELLARAPSVKAALDELAFQPSPVRLPEGTQSALAVLGEEDFKL